MKEHQGQTVSPEVQLTHLEVATAVFGSLILLALIAWNVSGG